MLKNYQKLSKEQRKEFNNELSILNFKLGGLIVPIVGAIGLCLVLVTLFTYSFGKESDFFFLWGYLLLTAMCVIYYIVQMLLRNKNDLNISIKRVISWTFTIFLVVWSVCFGLLDSFVNHNGSPMLLLAIVMGLAGIVNMHPKQSIFLFTPAFAVYCVLDYTYMANSFELVTVLRYMLFLGIALLVSFTKFNHRAKEYYLRLKLKQQNEQLRHNNSQLSELNHSLEKISMTDRLTGLRNRWAFTTRLASLYKECLKEGRVMSMGMFDLDDFKLVNDRYGHDVGDQVLVAVSEIFAKYVPPQDLFRYGGEEFIVMFDTRCQERVTKILDAIRLEIEYTPISELSLTITVSCGQFSAVPTVGVDAERFLINADRALYAAKTSGKNRVSVYSIDENEIPQ